MTTYDPRFLDAVESLHVSDWHGVVWRHMFNDYPPERANISGARWNPRGVSAIYTALDKATALAEGQNAVDSQPLRFYKRRRLYEIEASAMDLVELTSATALASVGLSEEDLIDPSFEACQRVGGAVAWLGRGGLLVPSARNDGNNLVILVDGGDFEMRTLSVEDHLG